LVPVILLAAAGNLAREGVVKVKGEERFWQSARFELEGITNFWFSYGRRVKSMT